MPERPHVHKDHVSWSYAHINMVVLHTYTHHYKNALNVDITQNKDTDKCATPVI